MQRCGDSLFRTVDYESSDQRADTIVLGLHHGELVLRGLVALLMRNAPLSGFSFAVLGRFARSAASIFLHLARDRLRKIYNICICLDMLHC